MMTTELTNRIDKLWTEFWTGGITNPLTVIEQITFLMFSRLLDIRESLNEKRKQRTGKSFKPVFEPNKVALRWSYFKNLSSEDMLRTVRDKVFPHFRDVLIEGSKLSEYMKDAQLMIQKGSLLVSAVKMIDELPLTEGDFKGDLYEYLLSKLTTAGVNGQFRTPRHIIRLMVDMLAPDPAKKETVCDPACGTAGFLVGAIQHTLEKYSSKQGVIEHESGEKTYLGDELGKHSDHFQNDMFYGFDFDATMLRIAAMNMLLHGVDNPHINYQDSLSGNFVDRFPDLHKNKFDVILANPPFKGSLDFEDVEASLLSRVKTKKTELIFITLMLKMLKMGGRCATIVPDGVLFGSSKAHVELRKLLIDENQLEGIVSLPSGVFKPYAGVSTAIMIFAKGGNTDHVWFYDVESDGRTLDDKRQVIGDGKGDLPDVLAKWQSRDSKKKSDRIAKSFFVPVSEIIENGYDLSINKYKKTVYKEETYEAPKVILKKMMEMERGIQKDMEELGEML